MEEVDVVRSYNPLAGVIYLVAGIIEVLLALRFVFLLFNVNGIDLVNFVYNITYIFVQPFYGLFGHTFISGTPRIEFESLIAIFVVAIVATLLAAVIRMLP